MLPYIWIILIIGIAVDCASVLVVAAAAVAVGTLPR